MSGAENILATSLRLDTRSMRNYLEIGVLSGAWTEDPLVLSPIAECIIVSAFMSSENTNYEQQNACHA